MGGSDLTTEVPGAGNGEVVDDDRPSHANGQAAKKRKKQKALAAAAANGHASKAAAAAAPNGAAVPKRKPKPRREDPAEEKSAPELVHASNGNGLRPADPAGASNGAVVADEPPAELPVADELDVVLPLADEPPAELPERATRPRARRLADQPPAELPVADERLAELPLADELDLDETGLADELDEDEAEDLVAADAPAKRGLRARRRASKPAKADDGEPALRGRAARRAREAQPVTPATRRAELLATAHYHATAAASAPAAPEPRRAGKIARRVVALLAVLMIPGSVYALVTVDGPGSELPRADAAYMSAQLMTADQRVRRQLVRLRPMQTSAALARTRDATLTARSLALELGNFDGTDAGRLRRALRLESLWLDAVGSVLSNPRSELRHELIARDAALRPALKRLLSPPGRREGGARQLLRYANSRIAAKRGAKRKA